MEATDIARLHEQFDGQCVTVDARRPELAFLAGKVGRVVTISANGTAVVRFEGADASWHDIHPEFLKIAAKPGEGG